MQSAFDPVTGEWEVAWPQRISQHDLVYLSPPEDPCQGIPLGNGDLGALLWTEKNQLLLAINKCDTWDDRSTGPFRAWDPNREEQHPSLRHCAHLVLDFGQPVFDLLYQEDFEARLELAQATARVRARTPFAQVRTASFVSASHRALVLDVEIEGDDPSCAVRLERWGSRTFAHWYRQVRRDPAAGLEGTRAEVERGRIVIEQECAQLNFVVAAQLVSDVEPVPVPTRMHRRAGQYVLPSSRHIRFSVYLTVVTSENAVEPRAEAHRLLDGALAAREEVGARHRSDWRRFWEASYVSLPQSYLENVWYLVQYFANSSSRGAYPPHFCNGLWGWNRDYAPWNYYFHWNMQWYVWPLHPANHADLSQPYFAYRRRQLEHARAFARDNMGRPGAFYADVSDRHGYNDLSLNENHTPGAQLAMDFWRHYRYTGDEAFLQSAAWPVLREVTRFMASCLTVGDDGIAHVAGGSAYEGTAPFKDPVTDLAMIRALFPVAIEVAGHMGHDAAEVGRWRELLERLAPFRLERLTDGEVEERAGQAVLRGGIGAGSPVPSRYVLAVGQDQEDGAWIRMRYAGIQTEYYGIPDPEIAPVFPAGIVGLADRDAPLFNAMVTQLLMHPSAVPDPAQEPKASLLTSGELCVGWCPYPIALARLGLAPELVAELEYSVSTWQFYPQGFGHWGTYHVAHQDHLKRWRVNRVTAVGGRDERGEQEEFPFPTWPFRYFDNEPMPIVATAINELLLQSHEGLIRVCPATPRDWPVRFTLLAQGGLLVSIEKTGDAPDWVFIRSLRGGECRLANPWPGQARPYLLEIEPCVRRTHAIAFDMHAEGAAAILSWKTVAGHGYLLSPTPIRTDEWHVVPLAPQTNQEPRILGDATLGLPRMY